MSQSLVSVSELLNRGMLMLSVIYLDDGFGREYPHVYHNRDKPNENSPRPHPVEKTPH